MPLNNFTPLINTQNVSTPCKQSKDYEEYYDDSSDEEDNYEIENNIRIKWFEKELEIIEISAEKINKYLSFLAHEFRLRLLKSCAVNKLYYPLKQKELATNIVLSNEMILESIGQALTTTFKETYNLKAQNILELEKNKKALNEFVDNILNNKRTFIKAVNQKKLAPFLEILKQKIQLPLDTIELTKTPLIELTIEIYKENNITININPRESGKAKITYNKAARNKLEKYVPTSLIKQRIKQKN